MNLSFTQIINVAMFYHRARLVRSLSFALFNLQGTQPLAASRDGALTRELAQYSTVTFVCQQIF